MPQTIGQVAYTTWDFTNGALNWIVDEKTKSVEELKLPHFTRDVKELPMRVQDWSPDGLEQLDWR